VRVRVVVVVTLRPGDCPSFYRPRRGSLQACCTVLATCGGMAYSAASDGRPGESCFWRSVMACPMLVQERLRGWRRGSFTFGRRPYADSRVQLTGGRKGHNSRCGGVLSPHTPTTSGMVLQCPGWRRDGGDGRTGPMVTEETRLTGPTSRHGPGRARNRRSYEGGRHSVTELTLALPHSVVEWRGWPHREGWRNSVGI
jgi:hypothetical protein